MNRILLTSENRNTLESILEFTHKEADIHKRCECIGGYMMVLNNVSKELIDVIKNEFNNVELKFLKV